MDEVKLGMAFIAMLGMVGLAVILFTPNAGNTQEVTAFSLSVGGLIAALVRGSSGGRE